MNEQGTILDTVQSNIKEIYSARAAMQFSSNPMIVACRYNNNAIQRGIVNRLFISKLLVFRAKSNVPVVDAIYCLIPDGDDTSWMNVLKLVILPFLKENQVPL